MSDVPVQGGSAAPPHPSAEHPLQGGCLCGAVRFEVSEPFTTAGYCHCTHCQRRTGTSSSANARVPASGFRILEGASQVRSYSPPSGLPKAFCANCGSALFSGDPAGGGSIGVRLGTLDADPPIRPQWRQYLRSAVAWEQVPEDGLERHQGPRSG